MSLTLRIAALSVALSLPLAAHAADEHFIVDGAAIGGYDVVAYHTVGAPTKGDANFTAMYQGVKWKFASAENRDKFAAEPAKFAPAYGGWCSVGASKGKKIKIDPAFFAVVDGQLFLNSSKGAHENVFLSDVSGTISKGDMNWRTIFATEADKL
jgi:YHS domain-containing protein